MKKILKNKIVIFVALALIFVVIGLIIFFAINSKKLTNLEKIKIEETSKKIENYIDEIISNEEDEGKYINYAIEYLYNTTDNEEYSIKDIVDTVNNAFAIDYTEEKILKIGITVGMVNKGIVFDSANGVFKYNSEKTKADIANTPLVKYEIKKIKKVNKSKFKVQYEKYIVENPNEVYNYYHDKNTDKEDKDELYDTKEIVDYLKGNAKIDVIKKYIDKDNIEKIGRIEKGPELVYIIKDDKLVIEEK